jgi:class 3 adenylate cyclase
MSPTADPSDLKFAHILFMDIVGFTAGDDSDPDRQLAQQVSIVQELQELVSQQPEFRRASSSDELLCIPTGDGMALVFFQDPLAPLQCAVQLSRALRDRPHLQLRMGIHSGPVYRVADINANANVQGGGINLAQRVMDCGEAGHILVSDAVKALVGQVGAWPMEDIGVYEVKHGKSVQLYNVHSREFGNPSPPRRKQLRGGVAGQKVVLLYRRGADPDEGLLQLLAAHLAGAGAEVFWDRQIKVGMKWAEEIERQIRGADAVIPLLSEQSMHSEMLACELQMARETAESRQGKPRILPIRVRYTGALPEGVAVVLDQIEYALWESPADDQRLLDEILAGLAAPAPEARTAPPRSARSPSARASTSSAPPTPRSSPPSPGATVSSW